MSVYDITLTDPTEPGRPATYVLHVTAVDQMVFVSICDYDEGNPETKMVAKASIGVSLPALRDALNLLSSDGFREDMRERDQHGPRSRIGGLCDVCPVAVSCREAVDATAEHRPDLLTGTYAGRRFAGAA